MYQNILSATSLRSSTAIPTSAGISCSLSLIYQHVCIPYCLPPAISDVSESPIITVSCGRMLSSLLLFITENACSKKSPDGLDAPIFYEMKT